MAGNLISDLASPLWALSSGNMSNVMRDSIYRTLAWAGLSEATVWRLKNDTCDIMAINDAARDTSKGLGHTIGLFTVGGCTTPYSLSYTSLKLNMPCQ